MHKINFSCLISFNNREKKYNLRAKIELNKEMHKLKQSKEDVMIKAEELRKNRFTLQAEI